jgi:hypothetical protein
MKKILLVLAVLLLTGCNYDMIDTTWNYDKVYCYYGNKEVVYEIKSWTDYDGEQIQIKTKDGSYLISMNQCYLRSE